MCDHNDNSGPCFRACYLQSECHFPFIRPEGSDLTDSCSETIAEYINPWHDASCAIYGTISFLLAYVTFLWLNNTRIELEINARKRRTLEIKMRAHAFVFAACVINGILCIDLKAYANRFPLVATEFFSDMAFAFLCCMLFHMITLWVDAVGLGGRTMWARTNKTLLPWICVGLTLTRLGFGLAQWLAATEGERAYVGTLNVVKLSFTAIFVLGYSGVGLYASVYAPAGGGNNNNESDNAPAVAFPVAAITDALKHSRLLHQRYLASLFGVLLVFMGYLVFNGTDRVGDIEKRDVPCTASEKGFYTNQASVIALALVYIIASLKGECKNISLLPQTIEQRRQQLVEIRRREDAKAHASQREQNLSNNQSTASKEESAVNDDIQLESLYTGGVV